MLSRSDISNYLYVGDSRDFLRDISDNIVDLAITSPPYHKKNTGIRAYGINSTKWNDGMICVLGEEPTEDLYVDHSMEIYNQVMRTLKPTGLFFLNIGYNFEKQRQSLVPEKLVIAMEKAGYPRAFTIWWHKPNPTPTQGGKRPRHDYEPIYVFAKSFKDLKDYYFDKEQLRKPIAESTRKRNKYPVGKTKEMGNGMTSRHTMGDIQLIDEIKEVCEGGCTGFSGNFEVGVVGGRRYAGKGKTYDNTKQRPMKIRDGKAVEGAVWTISNASNYRKEYCPTCDRLCTRKELLYKCKKCSTEFKPQRLCPKCNLPTEVSVLCSYCYNNTHPHHAMFPEELIEKIVKIACPKSVCIDCGKPVIPVYEPSENYAKKLGTGFHAHHNDQNEGMMQRKQVGACNAEYNLKQMKQSCNCKEGSPPLPAIILDPFIGYGTVGVCAKRFGADYAGADQNENNIKASKKRIEEG